MTSPAAPLPANATRGAKRGASTEPPTLNHIYPSARTEGGPCQSAGTSQLGFPAAVGHFCTLPPRLHPPLPPPAGPRTCPRHGRARPPARAHPRAGPAPQHQQPRLHHRRPAPAQPVGPRPGRGRPAPAACRAPGGGRGGLRGRADAAPERAGGHLVCGSVVWPAATGAGVRHPAARCAGCFPLSCPLSSGCAPELRRCRRYPGFRLHQDRLDGYYFFYPETWIPLTVRIPGTTAV